MDLRANKLFAEGSTGVKGWSYPPGQAVIKEGMNKIWHADSMLQSGEHCCHVLYKPKQARNDPAARYSPPREPMVQPMKTFDASTYPAGPLWLEAVVTAWIFTLPVAACA